MGTFDAFQRLVWSPQFKQNCFPHRSKMGVLKSFLCFMRLSNSPSGSSSRPVFPAAVFDTASHPAMTVTICVTVFAPISMAPCFTQEN